MANKIAPGLDPEEVRRQQEEAKRRAEEAARAAAEETAKAEAAAQEATQEAEAQAQEAEAQAQNAQADLQEQTQTEAPIQTEEPINPAAPDTPNPVYAGVRSGGMGRVTAQDKQNMQYAREVRESIEDTGFKVSTYDPMEDYDESKNKAHMTSKLVGHALGLPTEEETGNTVSINYNNVKSKEQAFAMMMAYSDDRAKVAGGKKLAKAVGMDLETFLAETENYMYDKYGRNVFSTPYSPAAKNRAFNAKMDEVGLMDVAGNPLDIMTATTADVFRACKMDPSGATADAVYALVKDAAKIPGNPWYGMAVDKDMFKFVDSADLNSTDYKNWVSDINESFTFSNGLTDDNLAAYVSLYDDIYAQFGDNQRVVNYLIRDLNKSFSDHTGMMAPTKEQADRALAETEALRVAAAEGADDEKARENIFEAVKGWVSGGAEWLKNLVGIETKKDENIEYTTVEQIIEEENAKKTGGGSSVIAGGGTASVGGTEVGVSKPIASTSMPSQQDLFPDGTPQATDGGFDNPLGLSQETLDKAKKKESIGPVYDASKNYTESLPYDATMTDEQAWAAYRAGYRLAPENYNQISRYVGNPEINGVLYGEAAEYQQGQGGSSSHLENMAIQSYRKHGHFLGDLAQSIAASDLDADGKAMAEMALMQLTADIYDMWADPSSGLTRPKGANMYDHVFETDQAYLERYYGIKDSLKVANTAYSENVVREQEEREDRLAGYTEAMLNGSGSQEMADALADAYSMDWVDVEADDRRNALMNDLHSSTSIYADGGTFWQSENMAALEYQAIKGAGSNQGAMDFRQDLIQRTGELIDGYTTAAHNIGTTLEKYLSSAGITSADQLMSIAYNGMQMEGKTFLKDPELQANVDAATTAHTGSMGVLVNGDPNYIKPGEQIGLGADIGWTNYWEGMAQAGYIATDIVTHGLAVQNIQNDYVNKYGLQAAEMYRRDLNEVIASGALSEDMAKELQMNMDRAYSIFDVGYEIDAGGLKGVFRQTQAELGKKLDTLNMVVRTLAPEQQKLVGLVSGFTQNVTGMGMTVLTAGVGRVIGAPAVVANAVGSIAGTGATTFSAAYDENVHVKGMSKGVAASSAFLEAMGMSLIENSNTGSITDLFFGGAGVEGMQIMARKGKRNLARAMRGTLFSNAAGEGVEESLQTVGEHVFDILDEEFQAYERGEGFSVSRMLGTMERGLRETDYASLGKEALSSFGAGFVYGGVFGIAGVAKSGRAAFKDAQAFNKYESVKLATQMTEGSLDINDENLGKLYSALGKDLQDKSYCRYLDKGTVQATKDRKLMTAMMENTAGDTLNNAVSHAMKAQEYKDKADAASVASETAKSQFLEIGERVETGELKPSELDDALAQWQKAQTAYNEAYAAMQKEVTLSGKDTDLWLKTCLERAGALTSEGMKTRMGQIANARIGLAKRLDVLYADVERKRADYTAALESDRRAQTEVDYAENAVFAEEAEIDEEIAAMPDDELDADIEGLNAQIAEAEARVAEVSSNQETLGVGGETVQALVEQEIAPLSKRKERIIAREKSRFNDAFDRMQQALEMDNEDAADEIMNEYDAIAGRLQTLGVDTDALIAEQYGTSTEEANAAYDEAQAQEAQRAEDEQYGKLTDSLSRRMEDTSAKLEALAPARRYLTNRQIYVNPTQAAEILAAEDLKNISQFNRRYGTKLTTKEADGAMPLDGHVLTDIRDEAAGTVDVSGDPVAEVLRVMRSGKELVATQRAEKAEATELENSRKQAESARRERVKDVATGTTREQREAAQTEQRAQDNVDAMDAEAFIEEKYPNATDEEKAEIRKRFAGTVKKVSDATVKDIGAFASRVAKKFKVAIKFVDSLDGAEGEYDGKSILIARDATQGDVVRKVILHELTHKAEGSGLYKKLSRMILDMKYGGDQAKMDADIQSTISRYQAFYDQKGRRDKFTDADAKQEIVADFMGEMLDGNQKMIDRLVADEPSLARKIVDTVKGAIDKLRGVSDPELDKMSKAVRVFERALKKAASVDNSRYMLVGRAEDGKGIYESNFAPGVPKSVKINHLVDLWQNVWSKNPIELDVVGLDGKSRKITANFDPDYDPTNQNKTDLGKVVHSKNGSAGDRTITLNLADDLHDMAREVKQVESEAESGKAAAAHKDVKEWHYFSNDFVYRSEDGDKPMTLWLDLKEKGDGGWVYQLYARKTKQKEDNSLRSPDGSRGRSETLSSSDTIVSDTDSDVNGKSSAVTQSQYSLPSEDVLDAEIRAWRASHQSQIDAATTNDGVSQFAEKTVQRAVSVPVQVKQEFQTNPLLRSYAKDTNAAQLERAMGNIERDGYEAEVNRLLDADTFSAEDTVEAGAIAISAFEAGDVSTGLEMALKYRTVGTEQAQAMQSRKMFAGMSPTHIKLKVAGEAEQTLSDFIASHQPKAKEVNAKAKEADDLIRDMQGGDESARVMESGEYTIDAGNSKWGVPINEKQRALIEHYKLGKETRPGIYYNRATTKQRMLEAILSTPDPDANSGNGLTLTQRLEWMKEGKAVVTQADLDYIAGQMQQYSVMADSDQANRAGDLALARAFEAYGNIKQPTKLEKARTWRYVSMLLSLPSAERNVIGNSVMNAVNAVTHDTIGVFTDWVTSLFTGKRTAANISFRERAEGWNAWADETVNTFRDYFMDKADATPSAQGEDRFNKNQRGRVYQTKAFEDMRLVEGFLMSVGDRNFWKKAYVNSLAEQQRVADMNGVELDYNKACEIAKEEANYATFNEDNFLRTQMSALRKHPLWGFVLDMIMPFTGVPTNITKRMVEYSPIGAAMTFLKHGGRAMTGANFDQRSFVEGISRGLSGTALWMIGMGLGQLGAINLGTGGEDDEKVYNLKASLGEQYSPFVRIGDENISLAAFAPAISPIIMGATAYDILKESDDKVQAFANALTSSLDQIFDASYMSGLSGLFDRNGSFAENALNTVGTNLISQNVPAFMTQIATAMDPYVRDTKDANAIVQAVKNGLIARIPGVREQYLNEKTDITGRAFESKEGIRNFIDPFTTTKVNEDSALMELDRLYDELGSSSHIPSYLVKTSGKVTILAKIADDRKVNMDRGAGENKLVLTADERNHYNRLYSTLCFEGTGDTRYKGVGKIDTKFAGIRETMESRKYQKASDEEKAEMISDIINQAKLLTQAQMVIDMGYAK